jgi:hypothetical protein
LVDLDGDGIPDLISGSWPGELFFFKGGPNHTFAAPVKLKDKNGKTINVGGGRRDSGDMILVAGDARFEKTDKGQVIIYEDERIEIPAGKPAGITGTASAVHAVDWDGDGLIDLLVGEIGGRVYLLRNEGTRTAYAFGKAQPLEAGGKPLVVPGDAGPFAVDWDGDGLVDLLVGAGDGSVTFFRNVGTAQAPKLAAGVTLVPPGSAAFGADAPKEPRRGIRAKVCAVDWDGDGRLDLLVGDFATQQPDLPEPSPEQKAEQTKLRAEYARVQKEFHDLIDKIHGPNRVKGKAELEKVQKAYAEVNRRMNELREKLPPEYENHGWVWFFRRLPAPTAAAAGGAK